MFYYRITTTTTSTRGGTKATKRATENREFLTPDYLGEHVARLAARRPRAITIQPINQATYIRATRSD